MPLLPGETILQCEEHVTLLCPFHGPLAGSLTLSSYKVRFISDCTPPHVCIAPLGTIQAVEKVGGASSKGDHAYGLELVLKDFRSIRLAYKAEGHSRRVMFEALMTAVFPLSQGQDLFAVKFMENIPSSTYAIDGWQLFNMEQELRRLRIPGSTWRITHVNSEYQLCSTYPSVLAVPASVTDEQLGAIAAFHNRARIPVLSWIHPGNRSSLTRGSQPLPGKFGRRSKEDEAYIEEISKANSACQKLIIMDARPKLNALANMAMGGGYEGEEYGDRDLLFLDIGNIHMVSDSLRKLRELCYPTVDDAHWMSNLEGTRWLEHLRMLLGAAVRIVDLMDRCSVSVFIHCSDGWDRTSQVCSLAMLLMDPSYRTITGFALLVEKEWLAFGHRFQQRIGHGVKAGGDEQQAPVFLQFIDLVWQLTNQFPCAFQFNEHFLIDILDHLYSCLFGSFLCNCERERLAMKDITISLWSHVKKHEDDYMNPSYSCYAHNNVLYPVASVRRLRFWSGYYSRFSPHMRSQDSTSAQTSDIYKLCQRLEEECIDLQKRVDSQRLDV